MPNLPVPASAQGLPNRRLFLAAGSAGAVFGALFHVAHAAPAASPELLDLIEANRQAEARVGRICDEIAEALPRFRAALEQINFAGLPYDPDRPDFGRTELVKSLETDRRVMWRAMQQATVPHRRRFDRLFDDVVAERLANFDALCAEAEQKRADTGLAQAEQAWRAALVDCDETLTSICACKCVSVGDVRAKVDFLLERQGDIDEQRWVALLTSFVGRPLAEG